MTENKLDILLTEIRRACLMIVRSIEKYQQSSTIVEIRPEDNTTFEQN